MLAAALASVALLAPMQEPAVQTGPATGVTSTGATVTATVDGFGELTKYWFQYGTSTEYGGGTVAFSEVEPSAVPVSATITALAPSTTYHYRIVAQNQDGELHGADATFTTAPSGCTGASCGPALGPIKSAHAPRTVRARARFTVTVALQMPAAVTIEIVHKGKLSERLRLGRRTGSLHARLTAPRAPRVYELRVLAESNGTTQTDRLKLTVS